MGSKFFDWVMRSWWRVYIAGLFVIFGSAGLLFAIGRYPTFGLYFPLIAIVVLLGVASKMVSSMWKGD